MKSKNLPILFRRFVFDIELTDFFRFAANLFVNFVNCTVMVFDVFVFNIMHGLFNGEVFE